MVAYELFHWLTLENLKAKKTYCDITRLRALVLSMRIPYIKQSRLLWTQSGYFKGPVVARKPIQSSIIPLWSILVPFETS